MTKPSVVRVLNLLMERGMIVKEYYGKIYLTDRGIFVAREVKKQLDEVLAHFPPVEEELTDEERFTAALALTAALPERVFTGRYDQLMSEEEAPSAAADTLKGKRTGLRGVRFFSYAVLRPDSPRSSGGLRS